MHHVSSSIAKTIFASTTASRRPLGLALVLSTLLAPPAVAQVAVVRLDVAQAVERAANRHPDVLIATAELEAAQAVSRSAGLPASNPALSVEAGPRFGAGGPELDFAVGLEQEFELGGQPSRRRQVAGAELAATEAGLERVRLSVRIGTRLAFAEALVAKSMVKEAEDAVELATEMQRVASRRHEAGKTSILEPNFAGIEVAAARRDLLRARREYAGRLQALRGWLAMTGEAPLELVGEVPAPTKAPASADGLVERALGRRADLRELRGRTDAAAAALRLERGAAAPSIGLSAGYAREGAEAHVVTGGLTIPLPLLQRNQVGVAEARGALRAAELELEAAHAEASREIEQAFAAWQAAAEEFAIANREALPLAEENLRLLVGAYEAGKEDLMAVLLLQQQALAARRDAAEATVELHGARAALEQALGEEIF